MSAANDAIDDSKQPGRWISNREDGDSPALRYAQRLAIALWEKHWKDDAVNWKPLPDLIGVLTQIDNMTSGLVRSVGQSEDKK